MQAVLYATGETNKLLPLTATIPPAKVPIVNRPVMAYAIELLARHGINHIIVSLHQRAGDIEAYFGNGQRWGVKLDYVLQRDPWGSAGAIKWAGSKLVDTFIFMPADALNELDITNLIQQHQTHQSLATVIVNPNGVNLSQTIDFDHASFLPDGDILTSDQKRWNDTGIYIFEPKVLDLIPLRTHFDIHTQLLPAILADHSPMIGCETPGYWNALDTFQKYHEAQKAILHSVWEKPAASGGISSVRYPLLQGREVSEGIWIGRNNRIHPGACLTPPVFIGDNCWIDREVELGPETFIGSNVIVDSEATITHSTILDHTYVGKLVNIENRLVHNSSIIDLATGNQIQVVDPYLLSRTHQLNIRGGSKRIFEFLIASLLFLFLLPLCLVLALWLKITEQKVFDRVNHIRPGETNSGPSRKPYFLVQFHIPAKSSSNRLLHDCLARLEWYRLPELWNVIVGDIGLVGVKPLSVEEAANISEAWQKKPYDYSPGITGLWYIDTDPDSKADAIVIADAYYTVTRNWKEDLRLLYRTPFAWIKRVQKHSERY